MTNEHQDGEREAFERIADEWLGYKSISDDHQYHMPGSVLREFGGRMYRAALSHQAQRQAVGEAFTKAFESVKESIRYYRGKPNSDEAYIGRLIGLEDALAEFRPIMKMIEQGAVFCPPAAVGESQSEGV